MRTSSAVRLVLTLLLPAPVYAQSVKLADLVGVWEMDKQPAITLTMRADSTFLFAGPQLQGKFQHWNYLKGDTLSFFSDSALAQYRQKGEPGHKVTLVQGQWLTLTALKSTNRWEATTYTRVDTPRAQPLQPADLVGTWVGLRNAGDSLIMWPDSTFLWGTTFGPRQLWHWNALTGDTLAFPAGPTFKGLKVMLNDRQQLVIGSVTDANFRYRFKRVGGPIAKP